MTDDVFEGTWTATSEVLQWDVRGNPKPQQACVRFEATETGYLMVAYGIVDGKAVAERPQAISTDGRRRPLLDLNGRPIPSVPSGAVAFGSRSDSQTLEIGRVRRKSAQRGDVQGIGGWKDLDRHQCSGSLKPLASAWIRFRPGLGRCLLIEFPLTGQNEPEVVVPFVARVLIKVSCLSASKGFAPSRASPRPSDR